MVAKTLGHLVNSVQAEDIAAAAAAAVDHYGGVSIVEL